VPFGYSVFGGFVPNLCFVFLMRKKCDVENILCVFLRYRGGGVNKIRIL